MTASAPRSSTCGTTPIRVRAPPKLSHPPEPALYGNDPGRAASNFDTFFAKGTAQTWQSMGKGHWATDPFYATKVIGIYIQMVAYAAGFH